MTHEKHGTFNPLSEIRVGSAKAMVDSLAVLNMIRDPDGLTEPDASAEIALSQQIQARMLITILEEFPDVSPREAAKLARDLAECLERWPCGP